MAAMLNTGVSKDKKLAVVKERAFIYSMMAYPLILFILFYVVVNFNSVILAFKTVDTSMNYKFAGFNNFKELFAKISDSGSSYYRGTVNALLLVFVSMFTSVPVSLLFGFYLYKKAPLSITFRVLVMLPSILSALISGLMIKSFILKMPALLSELGIKNVPNLLDDPYAFPTILVYTVWQGFSGGLILIANAMGAVDSSILESGEIDGLSFLGELRYIIVPLIWPTLSTFIILAISGLFNVMGPLYVFYELNAPSGTMTVGYLIYQMTLKGNSVVNYPQVATLGIVCTLIIFPITLLVKRFLEKLDPSEA